MKTFVLENRGDFIGFVQLGFLKQTHQIQDHGFVTKRIATTGSKFKGHEGFGFLQ